MSSPLAWGSPMPHSSNEVCLPVERESYMESRFIFIQQWFALMQLNTNANRYELTNRNLIQTAGEMPLAASCSGLTGSVGKPPRLSLCWPQSGAQSCSAATPLVCLGHQPLIWLRQNQLSQPKQIFATYYHLKSVKGGLQKQVIPQI